MELGSQSFNLVRRCAR